MNDTTSPYAGLPGFKEDTTSRDAAIATESRADTLREQCMNRLKMADLTADECASLMNENILSIRPRFSELRTMKLIFNTGRRRKNASGHSAIVWSSNPPSEN